MAYLVNAGAGGRLWRCTEDPLAYRPAQGSSAVMRVDSIKDIKMHAWLAEAGGSMCVEPQDCLQYANHSKKLAWKVRNACIALSMPGAAPKSMLRIAKLSG